MRVRGRSEFFLPSYTRCARSISMLRPPREGIHLERLTLRKPATLEPSVPSGNPTSRKLFLLLLSSISVIFSVSRSSWFLKSVTVLLSSRAAAWTESTRSRVCFAALASASSSTLSSLTELLVACMSTRSSRNAGVSTESTASASLTAEATTESKVLCCSLSASLIPLAIAPSRSSLEMVESMNLFFILDCPISLFRSPLTVEALMMGPMQSGSKFTDRIIKYLTECAEWKTTRASLSKGHVISLQLSFSKQINKVKKKKNHKGYYWYLFYGIEDNVARSAPCFPCFGLQKYIIPSFFCWTQKKIF